MGPAHGRLEMIRDHDLGHPTTRHEGTDVGPNPVGQTLAPGRFGTGRVGGSQDRHEDRGSVDFSWAWIDHGHGLARLVDKERLARAVALSHDQIELPRPLAIRGAELAVLQTLGGGGLVGLPQQQSGDVGAFELLVYGGPVRGRALHQE